MAIHLTLSVGTLSASARAVTATEAANLAARRFDYIVDCHMDGKEAEDTKVWGATIARRAAHMRLHDSNWLAMTIPFGRDFVRMERE